MTQYAILETKTDLRAAMKSMFAKMLSEKLVDALFVAARTPYSSLPMPTLFTDPEKMEGIDPLAPVSPFNAARQAMAVTRHATGKRLALVLRPCEMRALTELVKLNQCTMDHAIVIGMECLGRMENDVYLEQVAKDPDVTSAFYRDTSLQEHINRICKACEHFQPKGADLVVHVMGSDVDDHIGISAESEKGADILAGLGLETGDAPAEAEGAIAHLLERRMQERDALYGETEDNINSIEKFEKIIANCLNCYNCRTACPVCYCKECVFNTDVFAHPPEVLLRRAEKKGVVKMPTETTMFHMTRLVHMSHACVGCGHCSSVCPSSIPVADIFRTVAARTQELFEYEPGRNVDEAIPYMVYGGEEAGSI